MQTAAANVQAKTKYFFTKKDQVCYYIQSYLFNNSFEKKDSKHFSCWAFDLTVKQLSYHLESFCWKKNILV